MSSLFLGKIQKKKEEDPLYRKHPRRDGETPFARWNVDVDDDKEEEEEEEEEEEDHFFLSFFLSRRRQRPWVTRERGHEREASEERMETRTSGRTSVSD